MSQTHSNRCLILIDLQNEFLSSDGNFSIHEDSRTCLNNIGLAVQTFRDTRSTIFWIRSEYPNLRLDPNNHEESTQDFLSGTHVGRTACCSPGSKGAEFPRVIMSLIESDSSKADSKSIVITKHWYSAFRETQLLADLRKRNITDIFVGGLVTNVCVHATVIDARKHELNVTILEDCLGWRRRESHERALESMRAIGAQVVQLEHLGKPLSPSERVNPPLSLALPHLYYVNGSIPSWRVMMALYEKDIPFKGIRLKVMSTPKETRLPNFLALNHRGKTPVLVDPVPVEDSTSTNRPTTIVNESLAILQYLEIYHAPSKPLLPPLSHRTSRAQVLCRTQETENLHNAYDALEDAYFSSANSEISLSNPGRIKLVQDVQHELDFWEIYAGQAQFIAGDEFSMADCAFFPILAYMVHRGFQWRRSVFSTSAQNEDRYNQVEAWPFLQIYFGRVWNHGGESGCAQRAQPDGWHRRGKVNVWKGIKGDIMVI